MNQMEPSGAYPVSTAARCFLGLRQSRHDQSLSGTIISTKGLGLSAQISVIGTARMELPVHLSDLSPWNHTDDTGRGTVGDLPAFAAEYAEWQAGLVGHLLDNSHLDPDHVLAIGVDDPGIWHEYPQGQKAATLITDAFRLAEATGLSVIDAFPIRDLAQGGRGGPLHSLPLLMLLSDKINTDGASPWFVLEMGRKIQLHWFSSAQAADRPHCSFQVVQPGMELLDSLVGELTSGTESFDTGGRWAVQGRRIDSLVDEWSKLPVFQDSTSWGSTENVVEAFLSVLSKDSHARQPLQDVLCSATHLVVEGICQAIQRQSGNSQYDAAPEKTIGIMIGRGKQNGMLIRELRERCPGVHWRQPADLGLDDDALGPSQIAILAMLHVDHVPANLPDITGAEMPRILGRLTPGTPRHWHRLLTEIAANRPQMMTLRYAI